MFLSHIVYYYILDVIFQACILNIIELFQSLKGGEQDMKQKIRVTVWNEFRHEKGNAAVQAVYPKGIHQAIADFLDNEGDFEVRTATLDEPEHGLTQEVLDNTDVLFWWGHCAHGEVRDEIVDRVQ